MIIGVKEEVVERVAGGEGDVVANVVYSYMNNRVRNSMRNTLREDNLDTT
jgi:hypothetical protein